MMSLILMINGILNILMCWLFFLYTHKYRYLCTQAQLILYSVFSLYFLFIGFLRMRVALEMNQWTEGLDYSYVTVFNISNILTCIVLSVFLYLSIKFKGKIINKNGNTNNAEKSMDLDKK